MYLRTPPIYTQPHSKIDRENGIIRDIVLIQSGEAKGHNFEIDEEFIDKLQREVPARVSEFKPELLYWVCGLDTHRDSYGTGRLSERCYPKLAEVIKNTADSFCGGRLIVKIGCNAPAYVSEYLTPRLVALLGELEGEYKNV